MKIRRINTKSAKRNRSLPSFFMRQSRVRLLKLVTGRCVVWRQNSTENDRFGDPQALIKGMLTRECVTSILLITIWTGFAEKVQLKKYDESVKELALDYSDAYAKLLDPKRREGRSEGERLIVSWKQESNRMELHCQKKYIDGVAEFHWRLDEEFRRYAAVIETYGKKDRRLEVERWRKELLKIAFFIGAKLGMIEPDKLKEALSLKVVAKKKHRGRSYAIPDPYEAANGATNIGVELMDHLTMGKTYAERSDNRDSLTSRLRYYPHTVREVLAWLEHQGYPTSRDALKSWGKRTGVVFSAGSVSALLGEAEAQRLERVLVPMWKALPDHKAVYGHLTADTIKWKNTTYRELLLYAEKGGRTIFKLFPVETADQTSRAALIAYLKKCFSPFGDAVLQAITSCGMFGDAELSHVYEHVATMMVPEEISYVAIRGSVPFDAGIAHVETELAEIRAVEERLQMLVELLRSEQPNDPMFMPIGELMREEELLQDGVESIDVEKHFRRFAELVEELSDGSLSQKDAGKMSSADVLLWFSERMLERCSEMEAQISRIAEKGERIGYVPGWSTTDSTHFGARDSFDADTVLEMLSQQERSQKYALTASRWPVNVKLIVIGSRKLIRKAKKADGDDTITLEIEEVEAMLTNTCQAKEDLAGKNCIFVRI